MLNIGIRKHKLLVYIHITLKKGPQNFHEFLKLDICECAGNFDIFSKTHREISCFLRELGWS